MWADTTIIRFAGRRFQLHDFISNLGRFDSLTIGSGTPIAFVTRRAWYNSITQAIDSLGLNAARIKFTSNADGRRTGVTLPTTPVVTLGQRTTTIHTVQDDTLSPGPLGANLTRRYGYDDLGRMWYDVNSAGDKWTKFGYDGLSRLTSADYRRKTFFSNNCSVDGDNGWLCDDGISTSDSLKSYSYDQVGNRTDNSGTYTTGNRVQTFAGFTFEHDLDGNVTRKYGNGQDVRYYWSAESRLDSVVAGTVRIAYAYDPRGQLVRKRVNGNDSRFFLWHGNHLIAELDSTAQKRIGEYAYYPGIDQPLALVTGDTTPVLTRFFRQDPVGNVTGVLRDSSVNQKSTYDAWGKEWITGSLADTNRLHWKGLMWEGDSTRLYYVRARWYDPTGGRFVSEDPIGLSGGLNSYLFAGDRPVGGFDPSGMLYVLGGDGCLLWEEEISYPLGAQIEVTELDCPRDGGGGAGSNAAFAGGNLRGGGRTSWARQLALDELREGQRRRARIHEAEMIGRFAKCVLGVAALEANAFETGELFVGTAQVAAGLGQAVVVGGISGVTGVTAATDAAVMGGAGMVYSGLLRVGSVEALSIKGISSSLDIASGEFGWGNLVPGVGAVKAYHTIADNC
jgi:RHS repeat-associated protein